MDKLVILFTGVMDSFEAGRIEEGTLRCKPLNQALKSSSFKAESKVIERIIKSAKNGASGEYLFSKTQSLFFSVVNSSTYFEILRDENV